MAKRKHPIELRWNAKKKMIPKEGFNLVGVDTFEDPGHELYLISHYATQHQADEALRQRKRKNPDETVYIYGPKSG